MPRKAKVTVAALSAAIMGLVGFISWWLLEEKRPQPAVTDFESCVEAGHVVFQTKPRQCRTDEGTIYTEQKDFGEKSPDPADLNLPV